MYPSILLPIVFVNACLCPALWPIVAMHVYLDAVDRVVAPRSKQLPVLL